MRQNAGRIEATENTGALALRNITRTMIKGAAPTTFRQSLLKRNIMSTTPLYAAQVIIPKQQDNSITAAVAMITINQNTNKD
jgi:hypothetical protein